MRVETPSRGCKLALEDRYLLLPFHPLLGLLNAVVSKFTFRAVPEIHVYKLYEFEAQAMLDFAYFPIHGEGHHI